MRIGKWIWINDFFQRTDGKREKLVVEMELADNETGFRNGIQVYEVEDSDV